MHELVLVLFISWLAGLTAFCGGCFSKWEGRAESEAKQSFIHGMIALGGGILLAAVAFALVPEGMANLPPWLLGVSILSGGVCFCLLDVLMTHSGGSKAQFIAMLVDFVPEAIALGAVFGHDHRLGYLLAAFIGAQNLPEGFNAFREFVKLGMRASVALKTLLAISLLGPIAVGVGFTWLNDQPVLTAALMSFAGGGILYLIFQDIAPQVKLRHHWAPSFGAVVGFLLGALGKQVIG